MSLLRSAVVVVVVVLLAVNLAAANVLVAMDRTVLNPGFVTSTLEEENAYQKAEPLVLEQLPTDELEGNESPPLPIDPETVADAAVDSEYLKAQIEPNIERTYAYLHGNDPDLDLVIDLHPAKQAIVEAVETEFTNASPTELLNSVGEGQDLSFEVEGASVDVATVAKMAEDESVYDRERAELRDKVRKRVISGMVNESFDEASNDELLSLVIDDYDPNEYNESEKEQLIDDNEPEIRTALRNKIESEREDEISAEVESQIDQAHEELRSEVTANLNESLSDVDPVVAEPVTELALVGVDGYMADMTHDEFSAEFQTASDELAAGIASLVENRLDQEVPDRLALTEQLDASDREALEEARQAVGIIDLLSIVLPVVGLILVGLIYLITRSVAVTLIGAGLGFSFGGLPALVGASIIPSRLNEVINNADLPTTFSDIMLAITRQVVDAVFLQSAVVVVAGVLVLGVGLGLHLGVITLPSGEDAGSADK